MLQSPNQLLHRLNEAFALVKTDQLIKARGLCLQLLIDHPGEANSWYLLAQIEAKESAFRRSLVLLERSLRLAHYQDVLAFRRTIIADMHSKALAHIKQRQYVEGYYILSYLANVDSDNIIIRYQYAFVMRELFLFKEAIEQLEFIYTKIDSTSLAEHEKKTFHDSVAYLLWATNHILNRAEQKERFGRNSPPFRPSHQPPWDGMPHPGKTILMFFNMGFGDTIQNLKNTYILKKYGINVVVVCNKRLHRLLSSCKFIDHIVADSSKINHDFWAIDGFHNPLFNRSMLTDLPFPYLRPEPELVLHWRQRLSAPGFLRVAVNKSASDIERTLPPDFIDQLAVIDGIKFFDISHCDLNQGQHSTFKPNIVCLSTDLDVGEDGFIDTAAILSEVDLVITSDTSIAHLAGALSVPVWIALRAVPEMRWGLIGSDYPEYPSARLFRQTIPCDWNGIVYNMKLELIRMVNAMGI